MDTAYRFRGLLSILLTAVLLFFLFPLPAAATGLPQLPPQESLPPETVPEPTLPEETVPAQTQPEDLPPEETPPQETLPEQPVPTVVTIAYAKTMAEGSDRITIQGTVVYHGDGLTVLQDASGGIRLTLPQAIALIPGQVLQVTGQRNAQGLRVMAFSVQGSTALPAAEAVIGDIPEYCRVVLQNVAYSQGHLIQNGLSLPLISASQSLSEGDRATVRGVLAEGWFYADSIEVLPEEAPPQQTLPPEETDPPEETQPSVILPTVTATPTDGQLLPGEMIALHAAPEGSSLFYALSYDAERYSGFSLYPGSGIAPDGSHSRIYLRAYAVTAGGTIGPMTEFCFTCPVQETPGTPSGSTGESGNPGQSGSSGSSYRLYFGQLHGHTPVGSSVLETFTRAAAEGLNFFAITNNSNSFAADTEGAIGKDGSFSHDWAEGKAAAAAVTSEGFAGIFGYEMSWEYIDQLGHISTFNTPGWQSTHQPGFSTLESYYQALTTAPHSISQLNHPGTEYGTFEKFAHYSPQYDARIQLLETGGGNGYAYYQQALDAGWHLAPTNNTGGRTAVLATQLTEESLYVAMESRRVYATEDEDLQIQYTLNGQPMGSILSQAPERAEIRASLLDPTAISGGTVQVLSRQGAVLAQQETAFDGKTLSFSLPGSFRYYYLRILREEQILAVTAPVWIQQPMEAGIQEVTADTRTPTAGQPTNLTVTFYNQEALPAVAESLEIYWGTEQLYSSTEPITIPANGTKAVPVTVRCSAEGPAELVVRAKITGREPLCEAALTLNYLTRQTGISTIAGVRSGTIGQLYRVKGYVTAGNSNPYTTFPGILYLQDSTGGIAITAVTASGIAVGTPMEVTGYLTWLEGAPALEQLQCQVLTEDPYRYEPQPLPISAMDLRTYGGTLIQIEGQVLSLTRTPDGKGVSRFTLKDSAGSTAAVRIDSTILSGAYGTNQLTTQVMAGQNVRVIGILHRERDGTAVVQVRNCDEVVYVSALTGSGSAAADLTNPKTGSRDFRAPLGTGISTPLLLLVLAVTAAGVAALYRLKKQGAGKGTA